MLGIYSNKRLTENERAILHLNPDDYEWYMVVLGQVFKDHRFFQVREDIELPQKEDDDGVVLMMEGGDPIYFKTLSGDLTDEETEAIYEVCSFLEKKFDRPIDAYVLCKASSTVCVSKCSHCRGNIRIYFNFLGTNDGEEIIERLEAKLKNNEKFNVEDSFDHILLPYYGYKNKEDFDEKYSRYMDCINSYESIREDES